MTNFEAELGSTVRIKSADDDQSYVLVESKDVDPFNYRISVHSPLGRALLHKREHDIVRVEGPRTRQSYVVTKIVPKETVERELGVYGH